MREILVSTSLEIAVSLVVRIWFLLFFVKRFIHGFSVHLMLQKCFNGVTLLFQIKYSVVKLLRPAPGRKQALIICLSRALITTSRR